MDETIGARQDLDEATEFRHPDDTTVVDLTYLGLFDDGLDHGAGLGRGLTVGGHDVDSVGHIVDFYAHASCLLDVANDLTLGPDDRADLVGFDGNRDYARRVR